MMERVAIAQKMSKDHASAVAEDRSLAPREVPRGSPWALLNQSVADMMSRPSVTSERVSQGLLGEACRLLAEGGDWAEIRLERDGYVGWVQAAALHPLPEEEARDYVSSAQAWVSAEIAQAYLGPERELMAGKLPFGLRLPLAQPREQALSLRLPDGRVWWLAKSDALPLSERPRADEVGVARALRLMQRSVGVPYLWGGRTPFGYDCSGFSQTFCALFGVQIPRDADLQFQAGREVTGDPAPGDLLFFSVPGGPGENTRYADVRHVALSLGGDEILHASGKARSVVRDRLAKDGESYGAWLGKRLAGVRRFVPCA